jgi:glucosamine-6-phosphate deaminase
MDEYVGLPEKHPQSYHSFMWENFFKHIDIRCARARNAAPRRAPAHSHSALHSLRSPTNVNILNGNAEDLQAECDRYEQLIAARGGIELFLGGIGPDGHIAFNEPGSSISSRTRVKTLAYDTVLANSRFFGGDAAAVPKMALTVGVGTVMDSREVVVIVTGAGKAVALYKCIEEGVSHMWTVSALQLHQRACIVADEDATLELKVKTVRYFKSILEIQEGVGMTAAGYQGIGQSDALTRPRTNSSASGGSRGPVVAAVPNSPLPTLPAGVPGGMHNGPTGQLFLPPAAKSDIA